MANLKLYIKEDLIYEIWMWSSGVYMVFNPHKLIISTKRTKAQI